MVGETARRIIQLMAGNTKVQQGPVDRRDGKLREHSRRVAEIRLYHLSGQALEPFGGDCHRIRVLVEGNKTPCGQTFSNLHTVPCPTGGSVQVNSFGINGQPIQAGLQQHGYVRKFHCVNYLSFKSPVLPSQR